MSKYAKEFEKIERILGAVATYCANLPDDYVGNAIDSLNDAVSELKSVVEKLEQQINKS